MTEQTISQAISTYLDSVQLARSQNTARTYKNALTSFQQVLKEFWLDPDMSPIEKLTEDAITWMSTYLKNFSAPTERLYLTAVAGFYEYVAAERLSDVNLPRLRLLIRQRARRPGIRLPQFPAEDIERPCRLFPVRHHCWPHDPDVHVYSSGPGSGRHLIQIF